MIGLFDPGAGPDLGPGRRIATAAQMRELEAQAVAEHAVPAALLMENAARAAAAAAERWMAEKALEGPIVVLAGPGNNGGDGIAFARTLRAWGRTVHLWRVIGPGVEHEPGPELLAHRALWEKAGGKARILDGGAGEMGRFADEFAALEAQLARAGLVVDALFGTGLSRPLGEPFAEVLEAASRTARPVLALDLPSGVDTDTGELLGGSLRAGLTVTFGALKPGLVRGPGAELAGRVLAAEIGLPPALLEPLEPFGDAAQSG